MIPKHLDTLVIDGEDLRVLPAALDVHPFPHRSTSSGQMGDVQVDWPASRASATVTAQYTRLADEDADALILMAASRAGIGKTIRFSWQLHEPVFTTRRIHCDATSTPYGWEVTLTFTGTLVPL